MHSSAKTVYQYLSELTPERREAILKVRQLILENLPEGYQEGMQYGMIGYYVPLSRFSNTYNGQPLSYAALASQKNYMSLYLMNVYGNVEAKQWFEDEVKKRNIKLNMGKSCIRFKKVEDLPLDLVAQAIAKTPIKDSIRNYEELRSK